MKTDQIGANIEGSPERGSKCGGTLKVSNLVSGPEFSLDVRVAGVKYEVERGLVSYVGADIDLLGMKKYAARPAPAVPKARYVSRDREHAGFDFKKAVEALRIAEHT